MWKLLCFIFMPILAYSSGNETIKSFAKAKKHAALIHKEYPYTIYCHCKYFGKQVDLQSCGYKTKHDPKRASRLEWEHVVPAEAFGQSFVEWREGTPACKKRHLKGRKCAGTNPEFARMEGDLYNLWPEIGELNGLRSNFAMAELNGTGQFGGCKAKIQDRKFEPMDEAKGIVARVYQYMDLNYPGRGIISGKNIKLFEAWNKLHPVTDWECKRAQKIQSIQKNVNSILVAACAARH
jgi:deoxyribonuclease-1